MPEIGHFNRLQSLISGLARRGIAANVFTHRNFEPQVARAGGIFFDLFSKYPLEEADDTSFPVPCRFVSFAARYGRQICYDVEKTRPSLVIHDTFTVIGRLVAERLGITRVNVCAGHNVNPARFLAVLKEDPRVKISANCLRAVDELRESYGMMDASPFSYVSSISPHLNIYCEPPEFLEECERKAFEPIAFYGSIPFPDEMQSDHQGNRIYFGTDSAGTLKVYISFGTIIWRSYSNSALRALTTLAETFNHMKNIKAFISLGAIKISKEAFTALVGPNVSVQSYVDQWRMLQEVDVFFTHHGINSTHEAIFHRVPMVSYPFFWDQPALAKKCRQFGLAIPLTDSLQGTFSDDDVWGALAKLAEEREQVQLALSRAREWEEAVIENRPAVLQRIVDLIQ
jgi:UDP:flavonoid glycosyltransferase YjiC (YdhE family)